MNNFVEHINALWTLYVGQLAPKSKKSIFWTEPKTELEATPVNKMVRFAVENAMAEGNNLYKIRSPAWLNPNLQYPSYGRKIQEASKF